MRCKTASRKKGTDVGQAPPSYSEVLAELEFLQEQPADVNWRSLLYILTSVSSLWRLRPALDFARGEIDLESWQEIVGPFSHGEKLLAALALHLFNEDNEGPALVDVLNVLDEKSWWIFNKALHLRRYGRLPTE